MYFGGSGGLGNRDAVSPASAVCIIEAYLRLKTGAFFAIVFSGDRRLQIVNASIVR
jgi:hypothetical protein